MRETDDGPTVVAVDFGLEGVRNVPAYYLCQDGLDTRGHRPRGITQLVPEPQDGVMFRQSVDGKWYGMRERGR